MLLYTLKALRCKMIDLRRELNSRNGNLQQFQVNQLFNAYFY